MKILLREYRRGPYQAEMYKAMWENLFEELKLNKDGALRHNTLFSLEA